MNLKAVLPPAELQLPEDKQYSQWSKDYAEKCGVELRAAMDVDLRAPEAKSLMDSHRETNLYKGIGSSMNISPVKPEVPLCDNKQCVLMSDVAKSIRSQLDGKVVGYAFFLAGCSSMRSEAYGSAQTNADSATGFTPTTKMQVASVSKVITALAAIRVIAEKQRTDPSLKQGLDSPIGPYLPTWNWGNQNGVPSITFRQLLSQTSGVRNYGNFSMDYSTLKKFFSKPVVAGNDRCAPSDDSTSVDAVNPAIVTDKTTACYSNLNFALLRVLLPRIIGYGGDDEEAYATQYVQIVQDKVFKPLGITDADCKPPSKGSYAFAYTFPGSSSGKDFGDQRKECGSKGWYLSVEDLGNVLLSLNGADGRDLHCVSIPGHGIEPGEPCRRMGPHNYRALLEPQSLGGEERQIGLRGGYRAATDHLDRHIRQHQRPGGSQTPQSTSLPDPVRSWRSWCAVHQFGYCRRAEIRGE